MSLAVDRYSRQSVLPEVGAEGQDRLAASSVLLVGCGALGCVLAGLIVRAGVGRVVLADRDYIELNNLQRQLLYDEEDVARGLPKAVAAAEKLAKANSLVSIEPVVADVNAGNCEQLVAPVDLVLDGTDNFETRLLLNDACVKLGRPWVYGGVIGTHGLTMAIVPEKTACLRCFLSSAPGPGALPTCDTAGVLGPAAAVIASLQAVEGLKILMSRDDELHGHLLYVDVWDGTFERLVVRRNSACPACGDRVFDYLDGRAGMHLTRLCGRDAVQVNVRGGSRPPFRSLAERLARLGNVSFNSHMLRFEMDGCAITLFPDGRAIVKGAGSETAARALYSRLIGS